MQVSYRSINLKDEAHLVESIKDRVCYVAQDARSEMARAMPKKKSQVAREVLLPDGVDNIHGIVQDPLDPRCAFCARCAGRRSAGAGCMWMSCSPGVQVFRCLSRCLWRIFERCEVTCTRRL